jgi:hypothetical protein
LSHIAKWLLLTSGFDQTPEAPKAKLCKNFLTVSALHISYHCNKVVPFELQDFVVINKTHFFRPPPRTLQKRDNSAARDATKDTLATLASPAKCWPD